MFKKINLLIFFILSILLSGCSFCKSPYEYAGDITGVIKKINDGSADYGIEGIFITDSVVKKEIPGKFRLTVGSEYNRALYEGQTITIEDCYILEMKEGDWETSLEEFIVS